MHACVAKIPRAGAAAATRAKTLNRDQRRRRGRSAGGTGRDGRRRAARRRKTTREALTASEQAVHAALRRAADAALWNVCAQANLPQTRRIDHLMDGVGMLLCSALCDDRLWSCLHGGNVNPAFVDRRGYHYQLTDNAVITESNLACVNLLFI